jgi:hypothetical protein
MYTTPKFDWRGKSEMADQGMLCPLLTIGSGQEIERAMQITAGTATLM